MAEGDSVLDAIYSLHHRVVHCRVPLPWLHCSNPATKNVMSSEARNSFVTCPIFPFAYARSYILDSSLSSEAFAIVCNRYRWYEPKRSCPRFSVNPRMRPFLLVSLSRRCCETPLKRNKSCCHPLAFHQNGNRPSLQFLWNSTAPG